MALGKNNMAAPSTAAGHDPFLAAAVQPLPDPEFSLAELDIHQVHEAVFMVPADEVGGRFSLSSDVMSALRGEIQAWLQYLRDKGNLLTELLSATARDQAVRQMIQRLLESAYNSPSKSWMTALPTGRQVIIAPSSLFEVVGYEGICRVAHERAIRTAQANGRPFNHQALSRYQASRQMEVSR